MLPEHHEPLPTPYQIRGVRWVASLKWTNGDAASDSALGDQDT